MGGHRGGTDRSFGLSVGGVLLAIAVVLAWRRRATAAEIAGAIGAVLFVLGAVRPALLAAPNAVWWRFARVLGHVNARIILTVAFIVVLTPIGLLWRLLGRDPLARRRASFRGWAPCPRRYAARDHYDQMY
jgi:hypothetical protein